MRWLGAAAALLFLAACGRVAPAPAGSPSPTPSAAVPSPSPSPPPTSASPAQTPSPVACAPIAGGSGFPGGSARPAVADVRVGDHPGYERIVVEFTSQGVPSYLLRPNLSSPPGSVVFVTDPGGETVRVAGAYAFLLRIDDLDWMRDVYPNGRDQVVRLNEVQEVRVVGDFEAVVNVAIGLGKASCPTVTVLSGPPRLVIDFPA